LGWSWWRRRHQMQAQSAHYRRTRAVAAEEKRRDETSSERGQEEQQAHDVVEQVWARLVPLLPSTKRVGHPFEHERRLIFEAIVHVLQSDCGWRNLPKRFPPWQTVYAQYSQWRKQGIWSTIWAGLSFPRPQEQLQL
jgi:transposase